MRNTAAIYRRELRAYFVSPIAYFVLIPFLFVCGFFFWSAFSYYARARYPNAPTELMAGMLQTMSMILVLVTPVLTMRTFAEEKRSGTMELLITSPVREVEVVLGKFLASWTLLIIMLAATLPYPIYVHRYGNPDNGPIVTGYLGLVLLGACLIALGLMASSATRNQIVAAVTTFGLGLLLWVITFLPQSVGSFEAYKTLRSGIVYLSLQQHLEDFTRGVIVLKDVFFYISFAAVCLFLTVTSVVSGRWR
ncbi:ABC transporter permease subunit [Candidatus Poribacteria bacterium]|jgi:ABC-2 type transport system permease protein|nr:ABC transporter permease subunit [Candidatus Poribacteria bacterium]MBT5533445.1 ABC transporter permease subunit [Candidatus Poribacteria bacterium]MBT5715004.1 ABC transporter permease subunit [Candidatus Poribacteria bacterium]MBT7098961.1 ABC transporter permease subunit [Candidatus Poribacteria bacterium]MBT7804140.1 ABC transporter permease subunit [Candidatus Poribacteria bacterium]